MDPSGTKIQEMSKWLLNKLCIIALVDNIKRAGLIAV